MTIKHSSYSYLLLSCLFYYIIEYYFDYLCIILLKYKLNKIKDIINSSLAVQLNTKGCYF